MKDNFEMGYKENNHPLITYCSQALFAYMAVEETGYSSADIANYLGISESSVFHAVKRGKIFFDQS